MTSRRTFRHQRHALATLLTAGIWLPFWLAAIVLHRCKHPSLCAWCKTPIQNGPSPAEEPATIFGARLAGRV